MRLGKTNLEVNKNGFGALPIQRCTMEESIEILQTAYENGIDFYDTAHFYTDSEEKIGRALSDVREDIFLASKSSAETVEDFWSDLETSLKSMKTDYLDLHQFHNISFCPKEDDDLYKAMLEANQMMKSISEDGGGGGVAGEAAILCPCHRRSPASSSQLQSPR